MASANNPKKKIERANTAKDIESNDLEFAMINKLNMDTNSICENDMSDYIKVPVEAQIHQSWAKGAELEKAFSKHSASLSAEIEKAATEAKEGATEALTTPLQNYVANVCSDNTRTLQKSLFQNESY